MVNVFIKTFGCTANVHDSEVMAGLLQKAGHKIVDSLQNANIVVINLCTVKGEQKALSELNLFLDTKKKIVVAGCIPEDFVFKINALLPHAAIVGTHNIKEIVSVVKELNAGKNKLA